MNRLAADQEVFEQPKYVVNGFMCSIYDDKSYFEVRRYDKCFSISIASQNLESSPALRNTYLSYLETERSQANDHDDDLDDGGPEEFYDWALQPCSHIFESVAPEPEQNNEMTLHDYFHPQAFYFSLHASSGKLVPKPEKGNNSMKTPGVELDNDAIFSAWPSFYSSEVKICITSPEDNICPCPSKVLVSEKTICFFKPYERGDKRLALREVENYRCIKESGLAHDVRICRLYGIVRDDKARLIGLLLTYVDCGYVTLACAIHPDTPTILKQKWVDQVRNTLMQLHRAGIVWRDAKPENILIGRSDDAWVIDFGGVYTKGYVEKEKAGTIEGDMQGLSNIVRCVFEEKEWRNIAIE
ncbi:hypothetical protein F5884DRAFT_744624 [Xylogone sp. PMI_703]|nr:hypothetical protein F5884DRAFT_744624 [Xylogone sp. PMI_703]